PAEFMAASETRSFELDLIILDQGIGQELVGRLLERGLRRLAVAPLDLDVEHLALAHARHAGDAERLERALDRLALGIEDAGFEGDGDARLHGLALRVSIWGDSLKPQADQAGATLPSPPPSPALPPPQRHPL